MAFTMPGMCNLQGMHGMCCLICFLFKHSSGVSVKAWEDSVTIFFIVPVRVNLIVRVNCELVVHELIHNF